MNYPIRTFTGTLRQITSASLNPSGQTILNLCTPNFLPATKQKLEQRLEERKEDISPNIKYIYLQSRPFRRWSGDFLTDMDDQFCLDRGKYFSVCQRDDGYDSGTLAAELNAYRSTEEDFYVIFIDALIEGNAEKLNRKPSAHILALLPQPEKVCERLPDDAPDELRYTIIRAAKQGSPIVISLGTIITSAQIEGVIDLRYRETQQWFFDTYVNSTTNATNFVDILPELLQPHLGGSSGTNTRLQSIGAEFRSAGINGLVYPSARTDVGVGYEGNTVVRFRGWNIVLYKGQPIRDASCVDIGPWDTEFWKGVKVHKELDSKGQISQWYVQGLDALNNARYDSKMRIGL